ncbi:putative disease resistance protein-like [Capsicum annuum]|nr:putative disease resistance protein-like [Capsicum annuum]
MEDVKLDLNKICLDNEDSMLNAEVRCNHGLLLHLKTSWSDNNSGRRFRSCSYYGSNKCNFFLWRDGVVDERSKFIIPKLVKKVKDMNEMLKIVKTKEELVGDYSDREIMEMEAESAFTQIEEQSSSFVKMKDELKNTPQKTIEVKKIESFSSIFMVCIFIMCIAIWFKIAG